MKYQVVKIGDKYAVRKKWFHKNRYYDLQTSLFYTWSVSSSYFKDCLSDEATARAYADKVSKKIVVIAEYPQ